MEFVTHLTDSQEYFSQFLLSVESFRCDNIRLTSLYCFCKLAAIALSFVGSIFFLDTDAGIVWPVTPCVPYLNLIQNQPLLRQIFKEPPIISYRKGKSLRDLLVRAKL